MAKQEKMTPRQISAARRKIEKRLAAGELCFSDVFAISNEEWLEQERQNSKAVAARRFGDPNKPKSKKVPVQQVPVPDIARSMSVSRVLRAMDGVDDEVHDLILGEFSELDGGAPLVEIGSAEAYMLDAAVRLVLRRPKPPEPEVEEPAGS